MELSELAWSILGNREFIVLGFLRGRVTISEGLILCWSLYWRLSFKTYLTSILYFSNLDNPKSSLVPRNFDFKMEKKIYLCYFHPMDWGVWWTTVHRVTKSRTWLSKQGLIFKYKSDRITSMLEPCNASLFIQMLNKYCFLSGWLE